MSKVEELLKALVDKAPVDHGSSWRECAYCGVSIAWTKNLENPEFHKPDCLWREAKEYMQEKEA